MHQRIDERHLFCEIYFERFFSKIVFLVLIAAMQRQPIHKRFRHLYANLNIGLINKFEKLKWEIETDTRIISSWPWLCPATMLRSRWPSGWQPATTQSSKTPSGEVRQLLVTCRRKVLCRNFRSRKNTFGILIQGPRLPSQLQHSWQYLLGKLRRYIIQQMCYWHFLFDC